MLLRFLVLAQILLICGCGAAHWAKVEQDMAQQMPPIRTYTLPQNYRDLIDTFFVSALKDPDSRKITYIGNPYGSLICGTINAKNSYGGYTGANPFYAYFNAGVLKSLIFLTPREVNSLRTMLGYQLTPSLVETRTLFRDCQFL